MWKNTTKTHGVLWILLLSLHCDTSNRSQSWFWPNVLVSSDLSIVAAPWPWPPWSQVVTAADGFAGMALWVGIFLVVWNRSSLMFSHAAFTLTGTKISWAICVFCEVLWAPERTYSARNNNSVVSPTVVSHHAFEGDEVGHLRLVPAEDFSSGTEIIGEVFPVSLPHHTVPTQVVDFSMKWYIVWWPITC